MKLDGRQVEIEVRRISKAGPIGTRAMRSLVRHHTALLETRVKRNARVLFGQGVTAGGNPLSRPHTGNYIREINRKTVDLPGGAEGEVSTNAVQAARLEYGFVGADSLGRSFSQPPYPHWRPAADVAEEEFAAGVAAAIAKLA